MLINCTSKIAPFPQRDAKSANRLRSTRTPSRTPERQAERHVLENATQNASPQNARAERQAERQTAQNARPRTPEAQNAKPRTPGGPERQTQNASPPQNARAERQGQNAKSRTPERQIRACVLENAKQNASRTCVLGNLDLGPCHPRGISSTPAPRASLFRKFHPIPVTCNPFARPQLLVLPFCMPGEGGFERDFEFPGHNR